MSLPPKTATVAAGLLVTTAPSGRTGRRCRTLDAKTEDLGQC